MGFLLGDAYITFPLFLSVFEKLLNIGCFIASAAISHCCSLFLVYHFLAINGGIVSLYASAHIFHLRLFLREQLKLNNFRKSSFSGYSTLFFHVVQFLGEYLNLSFL